MSIYCAHQYSKCQRAWNVLAPLTFSTSNSIIEELRNIYNLKELISLPASVIY